MRRGRPDQVRRVRAIRDGAGRVRVRQRHSHGTTHLCYYVALLRWGSVKGGHLRNMARPLTWNRCPRRLIYRTQPHTQDIAHTLKARDLSHISPRMGSQCPRRLVYHRSISTADIVHTLEARDLSNSPPRSFPSDNTHTIKARDHNATTPLKKLMILHGTTWTIK